MKTTIGSKIVAGVLLGLIAVSATGQSRETILDIRTADGPKLKATYYSPSEPGPAIILLSQCDMDRKSWTPLARVLARDGIHVLTLDYRGYGESEDQIEGPPRMGQIKAADVDAAFNVMLAMPGVDKDNIAAGGASCGAHQAIQLARRSDRIKALALLSSSARGLEQGASYLSANSQMPIFAAASFEDGNSIMTMRAIVAFSKNRSTTFKEYNGAGHGAAMFDKEPALVTAMAEWIKSVLGKHQIGRDSHQ